jgi:hypothetical protein
MPSRRMGEWRYSSTFLDLGTRWRSFTRWERAPGIHWIGDWVGPRASLDAVEKRQKLVPPGIESWPSSTEPDSIQDRRIPKRKNKCLVLIFVRPSRSWGGPSSIPRHVTWDFWWTGRPVGSPYRLSYPASKKYL